MQQTPQSNRKQIVILGKRNAGKSSLLNAITEQQIAIVSNVKGTTTDAVIKSMELIPFGPVTFIDTAGLDDEGKLGLLRVGKTMEEMKRADIALFVMEATDNDTTPYYNTIQELKRHSIPHLLIINKCELINDEERTVLSRKFPKASFISTRNKDSILQLKDLLIKTLNTTDEDPSLIGDIVPYNGRVVMVVPIDSEAPKGRLILPQVQLLRDCLDHGIKSYVTRNTELLTALEELKQVDLVVTDAQAFHEVNHIVGNKAPLTAFSILMARQKGNLQQLVEGARSIDNLPDGARILIAETCTHNTSHEDIGRVKIPALLKKKTGKTFVFEFKGGKDYPENLSSYNLVIHCGGCMITRKQMQVRIKESEVRHVPITNYGLALAHLNGILNRSVEVFGL